MKFSKTKVILILCIFILSCSGKQDKNNNDDSLQSMEKDDYSFDQIEFTNEEERYIDLLKKQGLLKIATHDRQTIYNPDPNAESQGYCYKIIKSFTDELEIDLDVSLVKFKEMLTLDGEIPEEVFSNPEYTYKPDLFNQVDLYVSYITILPWRQQIFNFIDLIPTTIILVNRKGDEIVDFKDLDGKRAVVTKGSNAVGIFEKIEKEYNIELKYVYSEEVGTMYNQYIEENRADIAARDANVAIFDFKDYKNISTSLTLGNIQTLAWATSKDNPVLASILIKYLDFLRNTGKFNEFWLENYSISINEYIGLLGVEASQND